MPQPAAFLIDHDEEFPHLAGAPIVEAVINWQARSVTKLQSEEIKSKLVEHLHEKYPTCQPQKDVELKAEAAPDGDSTLTRRDLWRGFRFTSADRRHIAQFNRDGLVFSRLEPYEDWESFSAEGLQLWHLFVELAEPVEVQRLGVRFINRIPLASTSEVETILTSLPDRGLAMNLPMTEFLYRSVYDVPGHPYRMNLTQTIQPPPPPQTAGVGLILDIDVFTTQPLPCNDENLGRHLTDMRWLKNKAFFSQLQDSAVDRFREEEVP